MSQALSQPSCASSSRIRINSGTAMRRVRVVELDGDLFRQRAPVGVRFAEAPHEVGQRAGDQKIFLHEAQPLPHGSWSRPDRAPE